MSLTFFSLCMLKAPSEIGEFKWQLKNVNFATQES